MLGLMAQAEDPLEGIIIETAEDIDWKADPEVLVSQHVTPMALKRLYRTLRDADDGTTALDKAIDKALTIEKRLRKDAPLVGVNIATFDPRYLATIGEGLKELFDGRQPPPAAGRLTALPEGGPSKDR
jgi:hypothetical protein